MQPVRAAVHLLPPPLPHPPRPCLPNDKSGQVQAQVVVQKPKINLGFTVTEIHNELLIGDSRSGIQQEHPGLHHLSYRRVCRV